MFLDDDMIPSEEFVSNGVNKINNENRNTIYGSKKYKRNCNIDGYKSVNNSDNYDTVLTGCSIMNKRIIEDYMINEFKNHENWIIKYHGNCEDLGLNLFIRKYYDEKPVSIEGSIYNLDISDGYSSNEEHYKIRDNFVKFILNHSSSVDIYYLYFNVSSFINVLPFNLTISPINIEYPPYVTLNEIFTIRHNNKIFIHWIFI